MYKYDNELELEYSPWARQAGYCNGLIPPTHNLEAEVDFPSMKQFMEVASLAYKSGKSSRRLFQFETFSIHGRIPLLTRPKLTHSRNELDGFKLLVSARNRSWFNEYFGVACINEITKQIIVGHRGTEQTGTTAEFFGCWYTNLFGVVLNTSAPQISSAMTFAHKMASLADRNGYSLFFTGHSLGAWLAQVTCFSKMYLKVEINNNIPIHFVAIDDDSKRFNMPIPYTVGFDSPGAYNFLLKMRNDLFPLQDPSAQGINVEQLPVEIFIFHENLVNSHKKTIGTVFLLKGNPEIQPSMFGFNTHGIDYIRGLIMQREESEVVDKRVKDFKLGWKEWLNSKWERTDENCGEPELNRFSKFFLNEREQIFTREAPIKYPPGFGKFEGIHSYDEKIANELLRPVKDSQELCWMLDESSLITCAQDNNRQKLIPRIRHVVKCLNEGMIWWNSKNIENTTHTFERQFCRSVDRLLLEIPEDQSIQLNRFFQDRNWNDGLLLLTDYPGMGKSWALEELENILRRSVTESRIILRVKLKDIQDTLTTLQEEYTEQNHESIRLEVLLGNLSNLELDKLKQNLCGLNTRPSIKIYLLLDGVDEVYSRYSNVLSLIYHALQETNALVDPFVNLELEQIVLSTRPQFKEVLEEEYEVQSCSLCPLNSAVKRKFVQEKIAPQHQQHCEIKSEEILSLLESPHLILESERILKNRTQLNTSDFISRLVRSNCERFLEEKEKFSRNESEFENKVTALVEDKLIYYYHYVRSSPSYQDIVQFLPPSRIANLNNDSPTMRTLFSHGILTLDINKGHPSFEPSRFAEYFLARLLTEVEILNAGNFMELQNFQARLNNNVCSCFGEN